MKMTQSRRYLIQKKKLKKKILKKKKKSQVATFIAAIYSAATSFYELFFMLGYSITVPGSFVFFALLTFALSTFFISAVYIWFICSIRFFCVYFACVQCIHHSVLIFYICFACVCAFASSAFFASVLPISSPFALSALSASALLMFGAFVPSNFFASILPVSTLSAPFASFVFALPVIHTLAHQFLLRLLYLYLVHPLCLPFFCQLYLSCFCIY